MSDPRQQISDGYHTFEELYEHRVLLFLNLVLESKLPAAWRPHYEGWPVLFLETPAGQISYHFQEKYIPLIEHQVSRVDDYVWDGHTSQDVLERMKKWLS